jgi:hypothetical protein
VRGRFWRGNFVDFFPRVDRPRSSSTVRGPYAYFWWTAMTSRSWSLQPISSSCEESQAYTRCAEKHALLQVGHLRLRLRALHGERWVSSSTPIASEQEGTHHNRGWWLLLSLELDERQCMYVRIYSTYIHACTSFIASILRLAGPGRRPIQMIMQCRLPYHARMRTALEFAAAISMPSRCPLSTIHQQRRIPCARPRVEFHWQFMLVDHDQHQVPGD